MNDLDRTSLHVTSRSSSLLIYAWSTRSEINPEAETAQPGQRGTTRMHTHRKSTHTFGNGDTTQQPARDPEGELAVAAAAPPPPPLLLLLLLLLLCCCCCCCCCYCCCCCFTARDASRSTTRHNRLFLVFLFFGTHAGASNGTAAAAAAAEAATTAAAAAGPATREANTYVRVYF